MGIKLFINVKYILRIKCFQSFIVLSQCPPGRVKFIPVRWAMHDQSHPVVILMVMSHMQSRSEKNPVICILGKSLSDYYCQLWMIETQHPITCAKLILWQVHTWHMFDPSPWAYLLTQPMSTLAYCMCLGLIFFHYRWIQSQTETMQFGFIIVPTESLTNTVGNHFEIHSQWHIDCSLVNNQWSKIFTTEILDSDYTLSTHNYLKSILRVFWVQCWLPNWYVYIWSDCSIIYTVMDEIMIQKANIFSV